MGLKIALVSGALAMLASCGEEAAAPPPTPAPVITLSEEALPIALNYTAHTRGEREVEVRARVSGILLRRYYREGEYIEAGARMFQIDPAPFAAEMRSARGRLEVEQARLNAAALQWRRIEKLADSGFVSVRGRDSAEADYIAGKAAVASARADLDRAKLDLAYSDVRAPISGMTGREARSEGSYVDATGDSALLTTITQAGKLYIDFAMPEDEARLLRDALAARPGGVTVKVSGRSGTALPRRARIDFISSSVNPDTGTVDVKAVYNNPDGALAAGQFVRAVLEGLSTAEGAFIPVRAVLHGGTGPTVWVLDKANKASIRPIKLGNSNGNMIRVASGLKRGDRVVVDAILKLQPGAVVQPLPWKPMAPDAPLP
jgi:membrane fusion protein (multidrug efflux system)